MNRILLVLLLLSAIIYGCGKSGVDPVVQYQNQKAIDDKIVSDYIAANAGLNAKRIDTTGVWYVINDGEQGSGNVLYTSSTQVTVGYTAKLLTSGAVVAQTDKFHPTYILGGMIKGWQLGIPQIKPGGNVRLLVPSRYAYGPYAQDSLKIPANSVMDFQIQLYNVTN